MKRYGHGRYKKETATAADDEPTPAKIMKHEAEETSAVEDQQQQADVNPIPMVLSLLSQRGASLGRSLLQHQKDPLARLGADINNRTTAEPRDKLFNSQLVQEVSRHPALFDFTSEEYKSIEARNRHWDEVSTAVGQPLEFVRTRWKTLRDRFKKEVRRVQQNQPGLPWQHYEEMLYLLPFVRDKLEEIPYCGSGNFSEAIASKQQKQQQQNNGGNVGANMTSTVNGEQQQRPSPMNSCTAAILDLAMCAAMNNRFSPSSSPPLSNESLDGVEVEPYSVSSTAAGGTAIANGSSRIRSLQSSAADQPNGQITIQSGGKLAAASWNGAENGDEEDQLFCRIVLKKLGKLEERVKDTAKAKIMEILVEMQYGIVGGTGEYAAEKNSQSN